MALPSAQAQLILKIEDMIGSDGQTALTNFNNQTNPS